MTQQITKNRPFSRLYKQDTTLPDKLNSLNSYINNKYGNIRIDDVINNILNPNNLNDDDDKILYTSRNSYFGPEIPKSAQLLLLFAYLNTTTTGDKFEHGCLIYEKFFSFIKEKNQSVAKELKKSYFDSVFKTGDNIDVNRAGDKYYFSLKLYKPSNFTSKKSDNLIVPYKKYPNYKELIPAKDQAKLILLELRKIIQEKNLSKVAVSYSANTTQSQEIRSHLGKALDCSISGANQATVFKELISLLKEDDYSDIKDKVYILPFSTMCDGFFGQKDELSIVENSNQQELDFLRCFLEEDNNYVLFLGNQETNFAIGGGISKSYTSDGRYEKLFNNVIKILGSYIE